MANIEFWMEEKEYQTDEKVRREILIEFPEFPIRGDEVLPSYDSVPQNEMLAVTRGGTGSRSALENPHLISYARHNGRIKAVFTQEDGSEVVKYGTGFMFATNWVMTTATNIYDPATDKFADSIQYYPALGGDIENPPYAPVVVNKASIHWTMVNNTSSEPLYNVAFLLLDENADKPEGYCGIRYQYPTYDYETVLVVGYPNDLPEEETAEKMGTYMYRGFGRVTSTSAFTNHNAKTSAGYEGAPLYMNWGDGNGYVAIAMNAYDNGNYNSAIKLNRLIYGAMRKIRKESGDPAYCGGIDYKNVQKHDLEIRSDGYYECKRCGYLVKSPELQDKEILTEADYLKVVATTIAYAFLSTDEIYESVLLPIREAAKRIRSSERYAGMYDYQDEYGKCPVINPEQAYIDSGILYNVVEPEQVTAGNIARFNGIFAEFADYIIGFAGDATLILQINSMLQGIMESEEPITISLFEIVKLLAKGVKGVPAISYLLDLLQLGVKVTDIEANAEIEIGDIVVSATFLLTTFGKTIYIVYDEHGMLKNVVFVD